MCIRILVDSLITNRISGPTYLLTAHPGRWLLRETSEEERQRKTRWQLIVHPLSHEWKFARTRDGKVCSTRSLQFPKVRWIRSGLRWVTCIRIKSRTQAGRQHHRKERDDWKTWKESFLSAKEFSNYHTFYRLQTTLIFSDK